MITRRDYISHVIRVSCMARNLERLWRMNPQIDPNNEFERTLEGIRYYHMIARPDVYGLSANQKEQDHG